MSLRSDALGGSGANGGSGTAGDVSLTLAESTLATYDFSMQSTGIAGRRTTGTGRTGKGTGGDVSFSQSGADSSFSATFASVGNIGQGGSSGEGDRNGFVAQAGDGADGVGGATSFNVGGGTFAADSLTLSAAGEGGNSFNVAGRAPSKGGAGIAGSASLAISGGNVTIGTVDIAASGTGGDGARDNSSLGIVGGQGGAGRGGSATASITGGALLTDGITIQANGNQSVDLGNGNVSYFGDEHPVVHEVAGRRHCGSGRGGDRWHSAAHNQWWPGRRCWQIEPAAGGHGQCFGRRRRGRVCTAVQRCGRELRRGRTGHRWFCQHTFPLGDI